MDSAFDAHRRLVMTSAFLVVHGQVQREGGVIHVVAEGFTDLSPRLAELREEAGSHTAVVRTPERMVRSRDFH